jgi:hypothetical protein
MASAKRIDPEDTIDSVIFGIVKLQKEGWGLAALNLEIEYQEAGQPGPKPKKRKLPVAATMTINLRPI